jgi:hypothetical protein
MAKFAEGRFAEISLPNILHHQGLCTPSCAPPGEERASGLSHCSSIISGDSRAAVMTSVAYRVRREVTPHINASGGVQVPRGSVAQEVNAESYVPR